MTIDRAKIKTPNPKTKRPQSSVLPKLDHWDCVVYAEVTNRSFSDLIRTAVIMYIRKKLSDGDVEQHLEAMAANEGISKEELYNRIVDKYSK